MQQNRSAAITLLITASLFFSACNNSEQNKDTGMQGHDHQKTDSALVKSYQMDLTVTPRSIETSMPVTINISIKNTASPDEPVLLDVVHEQKIHLIAVNEDLTWFNHIHPQQQPDGTFMVPTSFPYAGNYLLFADYRPTGSPQLVHRSGLSVQGKLSAPAGGTGNKFISTVDDHVVTLVNGNNFRTNRDQPITIMVEKDGKKLTAAHLDPYLGADAHIVMISVADYEFMHIHSESNPNYPISGQTRFSKPGVYRMWVQFQTNGLVHTADFTVNVTAGEPHNENKPADSIHHH